MKRCPECRKDYVDDSLLYCLDDGTSLVQGRVPEEPATAILPGDSISGESPTRTLQADATEDRVSSTTAGSKFFSRERIPWIIAGVLFLISAGLLLNSFTVSGPPKAQSAVVRYEISAPAKTGLNLIRWPSITLSPDGTTAVFAGTIDGIHHLYARRRDDTAVVEIAGTEGASHPTFSPDGKWIAFYAGRVLKKTTLNGPVMDLAKVDDARGIAWASEDSLIYSPDASSGLLQISADGGEPKPVTTPNAAANERTHRWVQVLPGGKVAIFTIGTVDSPDSYEKADIGAVDLSTGEIRIVLQGASMARYAPTGHLIFARGGNLYAVGFDLGSLSTHGKPQMVVQGVAGDETTGASHFAIADDGTLAYVPGSPGANLRRVAWVDRTGAVQPIDLEPAQYNDLRISPDGNHVAILVGSTGSGDVWVHDLVRTTSTRLTFDGRNSTPVWSADGKDIYYVDIDPTTALSTLMRKPADGSREEEKLGSLPNTSYLKAITPDKTTAIFDFQRNTSNSSIVSLSLGEGGERTDLVNTPFSEYAAALAPGGRWLAYQSNESGRPEVYVRDMTGAGGRWQISTEGGAEPMWSRDGHELFYRNSSFLMSVDVVTSPTFQAGKPVSLFGGIFDLRTNTGVGYDVGPKGDRFLMIRPAEDSTAPSVMIVLNWFDELQRLAPLQQ